MTTLDGPGIRDVDAAVGAVLADLFAAGRGSSTTNEGVFSGRLLSLREAEALPGPSRVVRVAPDTVVTPLARDFLKQRGVEVRFASRSEVDGARHSAGEWGFAIESVSGVLEAFRRAMLDQPQTWVELGDTPDGAVRWVAAGDGRAALVLADEASLTVFRAYRTPGLRAASVDGPNAAARAVRAIGANLLVVEPAGKSIAFLKQIASAYRRGGRDASQNGMLISNGVPRP